MPPPQMTTSAVSILVQAPELEDDLERGQRGDVPTVEGRRQLDQVEADEASLRGDRVEHLERLSRGETYRRRDLGAGREGGVQRVDVERHVDIAVPEGCADLLQRRIRIGGQIARPDEGHPVLADELHLLGVVVAS